MFRRKKEEEELEAETVMVPQPQAPLPQAQSLSQTTEKKASSDNPVDPNWPLLPTPVKFEDISKESKNVLGTVELFDGFRFEFNKTLAEEPYPFGISHAIGMGSVLEPANYNLGTNLIIQKTALSARIDTDGHLMGRWQQEFTKDFVLRVSGQASPEPHNSAVHMEVDCKGSNWYGNLKWGNPGIYGISYMQSITPQLSLGLDTFYHHKQAISMLTGGVRYDTPQYVATGVVTAGHFVGSYTQKVNQRVSLATELSLAWPTGALETTYSMGFEYTLRTSHIKAHVDTNWKVSAYLEEMLNPYTRFMLCAELDHKKKSYRFGFGILMAI